MLSVRNPSDWTALRVLDLIRLASRFPVPGSQVPTVEATGVGASVDPVSEDNPYAAKAIRILRRLCWKDIDTPLPDGMTLLAHFDEYGCPQLARFVSDSGADVEMPKRFPVHPSDLSADRVLNLFLFAASRRTEGEGWHEEDPSIRRIAAIIEKLPEPEIDRRFVGGGNLLLVFSRAGCTHLAGRILDRGADVAARWEFPDRDAGKTAFDVCVERNDAETARVIAFSGAAWERLGAASPFPLADALRRKWYAAFRTLVSRCGGKPDSIDAEGQGVWHYAAAAGDSELAAIAGELGADPNARRLDGQSALHVAAARGDASFIRVLLSAGVDPSLKSRLRETPLALAVKNARPEATRVLEAALAPAAFYDGAGNTELHFAAMNGNLAYCRYLLFRNFSVTALNNRRQTPLDAATGSGALIALSVMEGKPPPALESQGQQVLDIITGVRKFRDGTPLDEVAARLIEHMPWSDLTSPLVFGDPLLVELVKLGKSDLVRIALARGAVLKGEGKSPLEIAFEAGFRETARVLLEAGAPTREPIGERTMLASALEKRWLDIARLLVAKGVNVERIDARGQNVWHYAAALGDAEYIRFARTLSCSPSRPRSGDGMTPLHVAASSGNALAARVLLAVGSNPFAEDEAGDTPLALALRCGHRECFEAILESKPLESYTDAEGRTLLHRAITARNDDLASYLIDRNFHVDDGDVMGETPLMIAVFEGDAELAAVLIDHGANPNARRHDGKRPRDLALAVRSSEELVSLLERAESELAGGDR